MESNKNASFHWRILGKNCRICLLLRNSAHNQERFAANQDPDKFDTGDLLLEMLRMLGCALLIGALLLILMLLSSCSTSRPKVEYLTATSVEIVRDTIVRDRVVVQVDSVTINRESSVLQRDSIAPIVDSLNRVIGYNRWHFEREVVSASAHQRQLLARLDSLREVAASVKAVREPYPVEVEKEVYLLRWWQSLLCWIGGVALAGAFVAVAIKTYPFIHRLG